MFLQLRRLLGERASFCASASARGGPCASGGRRTSTRTSTQTRSIYTPCCTYTPSISAGSNPASISSEHARMPTTGSTAPAITATTGTHYASAGDHDSRHAQA